MYPFSVCIYSLCILSPSHFSPSLPLSPSRPSLPLPLPRPPATRQHSCRALLTHPFPSMSMSQHGAHRSLPAAPSWSPAVSGGLRRSLAVPAVPGGAPARLVSSPVLPAVCGLLPAAGGGGGGGGRRCGRGGGGGAVSAVRRRRDAVSGPSPARLPVTPGHYLAAEARGGGERRRTGGARCRVAPGGGGSYACQRELRTVCCCNGRCS